MDNRRSWSSNSRNNDSSKKITIPTTQVGKLIGKAGSTIKALQNETNTQISVRKGISAEEDTEVEISGSTTDVEQAIQAIRRKCAEEQPGREAREYSSNRGGNSSYRSNNDHYQSSGDRYQSNRGDRYQSSGDRYQSSGDRYQSNNERNDRQPSENYNDRPRTSVDRYESSNDRYKSNNDRYQSTNDRYQSNNDRYQSNNDRYPSSNTQASSFGEENWDDDDGSSFAAPAVESTIQIRNEVWKDYDDTPIPIPEPASEPSYNSYTRPVKEYPKIDFKKMNEDSKRAEAEYWAKFPKVIKHFYEESPEITSLTDEQVDEIREKSNNIVVERPLAKEGEEKIIPKPIITFEHAFHNYPEILYMIDKVGFKTPTPIQSQAWPILLSGEDMIGIAQTGTGKTLAFILPCLVHIDHQTIPRKEKGSPSALVIAPTRELAQQIQREVCKYNYKDVTSICVYGGGSRKEQIEALKAGIDIIIATPGRLDDLVVAGHIDLTGITYVVLDEADRMLDMGFEPQIRKVMYNINPSRQTVMTSATWPSGVRRLAISYMNDPLQVYVGTLDLAAVHSVTQIIEVMDSGEDLKFDTFMKYMRTIDDSRKVIVFTSRKAKASDLCVELHLAGITCASIHGDLEQCDREEALEDMMTGKEHILIATDIASRGIDIENISLVLNYDFPRNIEEYVHRVGRTGRAGNLGQSITYFTPADGRHATELIKILEEANQEVPERLRDIAQRREAYLKRQEARGESGDNRRGGRGGGFGDRRGGGRGGGGFQGNRNNRY